MDNDPQKFAASTNSQTTPASFINAPPPPKATNSSGARIKKLAVFTLSIIVVFLLALGAYTAFVVLPGQNQNQQSTNRFPTVQIPLDDFLSGEGLTVPGSRSLTINGKLQVNDDFIITPSSRPADPKTGQIYYDQSTNRLAFFNGTDFIDVPGDLLLGPGITNTGGTLSNSGVLSVQGSTGDITLVGGSGIAMSGTTISNTGVLQVVSGSSNITVATNNGTVTVTAAQSGTVSSGGGTVGRIAKFSGVQELADSLVSESGNVVTVHGDLSVTGSLSLSSALGVTSGGTGATSLTTNGVVIGQGNGALTAVAAGGAGQCLLSTVGAPAFGACPGGGANTALSNLASVAINTNLLPGVAGSIHLGSATLPFGDMYLAGTSGTPASNNFRFTGVATAARTITLPDASGTVCLTGNNCGFATGSGQAFVLNGNSFTGTAVLGTNDAFGLEFETSGVSVVSIGSTGLVNFAATANGTQAFNIDNASGSNVFTVDTANSRVGINLGGANTPTLATGANGLEINGTLRLSGGLGAGLVDSYITPLGASVNTKINIVNGDPGAFGQILAMGLPASADNSARGILIADARSNGNHKPTLSILSPDENNEFGLSWRGSNSVAYVTTANANGSTRNIILQSGDATGGSGPTTGVVGIYSGSASNGTDGSTGDIELDAGTPNGTGTGGDIVMGINNASSITIGRAAAALTINTGSTTVNGTALFQNTSNSTTAFRVLNATGAGSVPQFVIDTTNSRVYIGNPTADNTGALLVLDTKNTSGDPTVVDGAMYYNSSSGSMRCAQAGVWVSCVGGLLSSNTAPSSAIASTVTETNFSTTYSLPANYCVAGRVMRITAQGTYGTDAVAPTLQLRLKMGSTTLATTGANTIAGGAANRAWKLEAQTICNAAPSAASATETQGNAQLFTAATTATNWEMVNTGTTNIATNAAQAVQVSAEWGTANANNTITLRQFLVEGMGP